MRFRTWMGMFLFLPAVSIAGQVDGSRWTFRMEYVVDSTGIGRLSDPLWSRTGELVAFRPSWSIEGEFLAINGKTGLFIHEPVSGHTSRIVEGSTGLFIWLPEGKLIYELQKPVYEFRKSYESEIHFINLRSGVARMLMSIPSECLIGLQATCDSRAAFTDRCRLSEWKADLVDTNGIRTPIVNATISTLIWEQEGVPCIRKSGTTRRILVEGPGRLWDTKASTSGDLFSVRSQTGDSVSTVIVTNEGRWVKVLPSGFHASEWSSDGRILLGMETTRDFDNAILSSRVALFDVQQGAYAMVETPPGMIPVYPSMNEVAGKLAFCDFSSGFLVVGSLIETAK